MSIPAKFHACITKCTILLKKMDLSAGLYSFILIRVNQSNLCVLIGSLDGTNMISKITGLRQSCVCVCLSRQVICCVIFGTRFVFDLKSITLKEYAPAPVFNVLQVFDRDIVSEDCEFGICQVVPEVLDSFN